MGSVIVFLISNGEELIAEGARNKDFTVFLDGSNFNKTFPIFIKIWSVVNNDGRLRLSNINLYFRRFQKQVFLFLVYISASGVSLKKKTKKTNQFETEKNQFRELFSGCTFSKLPALILVGKHTSLCLEILCPHEITYWKLWIGTQRITKSNDAT